MALDDGVTEVLSIVKPKNGLTFAAFEDIDGRGGYAVIDTITELDDVDESKLRLGMLRHVLEDGNDYRLIDDDPATWEIVAASQPLSPTLSLIAALTPDTDRLPYFTGPSGSALTILTSFARTLLAAVSATAARTALGLGSAALASTTDFDSAGAAAAAVDGLAAGVGISITGSSPTRTIAFAPSRNVLGNLVTQNITGDVTGSLNPTGWDGTEPNKAAIIALNATIFGKIAGLAGGVDGRVVTFINTGSQACMIPPNDTGATAADRFRSPFPVFLCPDQAASYVYASSTWRLLAAPASFDSFDDMFQGSTTFTKAYQAVATSGGLLAPLNISADSTQQVLGALRATVAASGSGMAIRTGPGQLILPGTHGVLTLDRVRMNAAQAADAFTFRCGLGDTEGANANTDGVFWLNSDASTFWQIVSSVAGTPSALATSLSINQTDFVTLGVAYNTLGTRADFFAKTPSGLWTNLGSRTASLPSSSNLMNINNVLFKTAGAGTVTVDTDYKAHKVFYASAGGRV